MVKAIQNIIPVFFIILFVVTNTHAQTNDKPVPFKSSDYPTPKYYLNFHSYLFSKFKIDIIQVKLNDEKSITTKGFYCRGWVNISEENKTIKQFYFKNIEALGGCSGLFVPAKQPRSDHFIISKFGDYDGSIIIIDSTGKITQKKGGVFFLSKDKRYLFSSYDSDAPGLTVYDLNKKRILFSEEIEQNIAAWYFQDNKYFSTVNDEGTTPGKINIVIFDVNKNKIIVSTSEINYPKEKNMLPVFNNVVQAKSCNCGR